MTSMLWRRNFGFRSTNTLQLLEVELPHHYRIEVEFDFVPRTLLPITKPVMFGKLTLRMFGKLESINIIFCSNFDLKEGGKEIKATFKLSAPGNHAALAFLIQLLSYLYKISVSQDIIDTIISMIRNLIIAGQRGSFYNRNRNSDKISQPEIAC